MHLQLSAMRLGQTQFERKRGITLYDRGWRQNVRHVLGERWLSALLWPLVDSPLPNWEFERADCSTSDDKIGDTACHKCCNGRGASAEQDQTLTRRHVELGTTD